MAYNEDLLRVKKIKEAVYNYRVIFLFEYLYIIPKY